MRPPARLAGLVALVLVLAAPLGAQPAAPPAAVSYGAAPAPSAFAPGLSDSVQVSMLTMLPGRQVYSLFGHSALRIRDDAAGIDQTYNFGTFDFDQSFFVLRFLGGRLDYVLDTAPFWAVLQQYQLEERPIIEQRLRLSPEAARALYARLEENALPQNRAYRYDFFWDNCSTRLLDNVDSALVAAGSPGLRLPPAERPQTFRALLRPYWAGAPTVGTGANFGLGLPTDQVASAREEAFLPLELAAQLDRATVGGRPLVASRDTLFWVPGAGLPRPAPPVPTWAGWGVLALGLGATAVGGWRAHGRAGRWGDTVLFGAVGFAGLVGFLLWTATDHQVTGPNLNVLWAWPTHLLAAVTLAVGGAGRAAWRVYFGTAAVVTVLAALAWTGLPQTLPAPFFPVALLLAVRAGVRAATMAT
ncbi:DUF4105 domain-containing protein [Rubrivirga sp. S365]|uniref:Lnb N-terminal periplasmic domain-containing protein n=1 Tax=Rubrivirga sp. S365 TaxID=3076080 RepID=UPI0028C556A1|nr:DUF4105 domain-containing protein [Rubrivirga sp. S365]MDT7856414.1 DUF4105 domain-containing protein [Rubrivirga sp. S365]